MRLEVDLHLTNRCPCRCDHCFVSGGQVELAEPTLSQVTTFISHISDMGLKEIHLTGGEPFLREDLEDIVESAVRKGLTVKVNTSGVGVSRERLQRLYELGVKWIGIGIEGVNPETHDAGKHLAGAHDCAIATLTNALEIGFSVEVMTLITKRNQSEMLALAEFLTQKGVQKISAFYYTCINRAAENSYLQPTVEKWEETVTLMKNSIECINPEIEFSYQLPEVPDSISHSYVCRIPQRDFCVVLPDGRVYPCALFALSSQYLGNVWERPLNEIWNDEKSWERYSGIGTQRSNNCSSKGCNGGCPAYVWITHKQLNGCDPRCKYEHTNRIPSCVVHTEFLRDRKR